MKWLPVLAAFSLALSTFASALPARAATAADLPCRTVKFIIPWKAGGGSDIINRVVARAAKKHLGKEIVAVNISGQGGNKGAKEAKRAKPNGCTLFGGHDSMHMNYIQGRVNFSYFDFEPIVLLTLTPHVIGANTDVVWKDARELVAYAKKHPKTVLFAATLGGPSHFFPIMVEDEADISFKYVSYEGTRDRMTALLGKHVHLGSINITVAKKYITAGKLKALGIATAQRDRQLPDLPTLREQGIDVISGTNRGVFAPKGTPTPILRMMEGAFAKAMENPKVRGDIEAKGSIVQFKRRADYIEFLKENMATLEKLAKKVGLYRRK